MCLKHADLLLKGCLSVTASDVLSASTAALLETETSAASAGAVCEISLTVPVWGRGVLLLCTQALATCWRLCVHLSCAALLGWRYQCVSMRMHPKGGLMADQEALHTDATFATDLF